MDSTKYHIEKKQRAGNTYHSAVFPKVVLGAIPPPLFRDETADLIPLIRPCNSINLEAVTMVELFILRNCGDNSHH